MYSSFQTKGAHEAQDNCEKNHGNEWKQPHRPSRFIAIRSPLLTILIISLDFNSIHAL